MPDGEAVAPHMGRMLNPLRGRAPSKVLLAWLAVTVMLVAAHVVQAKTQEQPQLDASSEPTSLNAETTGKRTIQFGIPRQEVGGAASLVVQLRPFDANGALMTDPVASYREAVMLTQHTTKASVTVEIPAPGLFLVDAKLVSAQGGVLASGRINIAAIPPAQRTGLPDFGVVTHFGQNSGSPALVLPLVKLAGFTWIRDELPWDQVEKEPGRFAFPAYMDAYVNAASELGIRLLVLLDYGNPDAYPGRFTGAQGFPRTPEERALFVRYVEQVVGRYGKTVKHWELWNEPAFSDIEYSDYVALLKTVYGSIKTKSPDATVISCGGGGAGGGPGGDCIDSIVSRGALEYQDGFSVHPYMSPHVPETGYQAKDAPIDAVNIPTAWPFLNELIAQHPRSGGRRLQLWITELGWSSSPASEGLSEVAQAANLVRSYLLSRRYDAVKVLFWYDFVDDGRDPLQSEHNFGLVRADLSPKPAFVAAAVMAGTLQDRRWASALIDSGEVKVYQYGTQDPLIAGWTIGSTVRSAFVRLPPGEYIQRDWQGAETIITVGAQGFDWKVGPLPRYLLPKTAARLTATAHAQ